MSGQVLGPQVRLDLHQPSPQHPAVGSSDEHLVQQVACDLACVTREERRVENLPLGDSRL